MPSVSKKQKKFMAAVAHGWKPPGRKVPSVAVAREFVAADRLASGKKAKYKKA